MNNGSEEEEANKLREEMAQITCLFIQLEASFIDLEVKVEELRKEVSALEKSKNHREIMNDGKCQNYVGPSFKNKISQRLLRVRKNIVIFGLHEKTNDENLVKTLFADLGINFDNVTAMYRIGS